MGQIIKPVCSCKKDFGEIFMGTGMRVLGSRDIVPSPCNNCKNVVETNLYNKRYRCPKCKRKVEPYVEIKEGEEYLKSYGLTHEYEYELEDKKYKCPNCSQLELTFEDSGCWD